MFQTKILFFFNIFLKYINSKINKKKKILFGQKKKKKEKQHKKKK